MKFFQYSIFLAVLFFSVACSSQKIEVPVIEKKMEVKQENLPKEPTKLTQQVAKAIIDFNYKQIPPHVLKLTKQLVNDNIAVAVGAHDFPLLQTMEEILEVNGGDHLILSSGNKAKMLEAIYMNSLAANILDFDDSHINVGHPGSTIIQPALVLKDKYGKSEKEFIEAVVAGYEFNIRWAKAVFDYPDKFKGPWSSTLLQSFGTVVAAGKLLDLTETELASAFYFAAANMPLPVFQKTGIYPGQKVADTKGDYGQTAQAMVLAVLTAKNGVYAGGNVLDGDQGLWRMMGTKEFHEERVLADLGTKWEIEGMQLKPYATCRYSHAAVDGLLELKPKFNVEDVQQIDVFIYKMGLGLLNKTHPKTMLDLQFSLPHITGLTLLDKSLINLNKEDIVNQSAIAISKKVNLHLDDKYEALFYKGKLPSKVVVKLKDGKVLEKEILTMKGEAEKPMSDKELTHKVEVLLAANPSEAVRQYAQSQLMK